MNTWMRSRQIIKRSPALGMETIMAMWLVGPIPMLLIGPVSDDGCTLVMRGYSSHMPLVKRAIMRWTLMSCFYFQRDLPLTIITCSQGWTGFFLYTHGDPAKRFPEIDLTSEYVTSVL
ncbi:hypothetical protein AVEN_18641-1 [Araneus ventricosus]|uniref:Uncharacterized protein n=1 Tax=Araneus ventricosus TaxID=182803 RepID=A0A4Y2MC49_ARAVE|nr:hypothetical protein AVEN_18641-1 [Araneus ventricosus]